MTDPTFMELDEIKRRIKEGEDPILLSIEAWEQKKAAVQKSYSNIHIPMNTHDCPLCVAYFDKVTRNRGEETCIRCPLEHSGAGCFSENSPYRRAVNAFQGRPRFTFYTIEEKVAAADNMINAIKALIIEKPSKVTEVKFMGLDEIKRRFVAGEDPLDLSIEAWELKKAAIRTIPDTYYIPMGHDDCPLCVAYFEKEKDGDGYEYTVCEDCPLEKKRLGCFKEGPYRHALRAFQGFKYDNLTRTVEEKEAAADHMINVLKSCKKGDEYE